MPYILAIDQGTTSTRAILFDKAMRVHAVAQEEFAQHFPASGWVEHDPMDLWATTAGTCRAVIEKAGIKAAEIAAIGITNQRETTLVWDRATGQPVHNAIVWQDRRTSDSCARLKAEGHEPMVTRATGLLLDPYFSGTKLAWILDHVDGARARAERGELLFGTVDSFLIWKLTGGKAHATDATNAARTLIYNIRDGRWDADICKLLNIPMADAARGAGLRCGFRRDAGRPVWARDSDPRRRGRPAGGDHRAGLLQPGHDEIDLRDGVFCPAEHGRQAGRKPVAAAGDHCLSVRRQADLCAGRVDLYRGRGRAVAA